MRLFGQSQRVDAIELWPRGCRSEQSGPDSDHAGGGGRAPSLGRLRAPPVIASLRCDCAHSQYAPQRAVHAVYAQQRASHHRSPRECRRSAQRAAHRQRKRLPSARCQHPGWRRDLYHSRPQGPTESALPRKADPRPTARFNGWMLAACWAYVKTAPGMSFHQGACARISPDQRKLVWRHIMVETFHRRSVGQFCAMTDPTISSPTVDNLTPDVRFVRCQVAENRTFIVRAPQRPQKGRNQAFAEALYF